MKTLILLAAFAFSPFAHAEQVRALNRGDESLAAFYTSIENATDSIDLATFHFEPCESAPKILLDALVKKAKSGVKVRLLLDAFSHEQPIKGGLPAYLATIPNFQIRYFNDARTVFTINNRSHVKAFVVDGRTAQRHYIAGGRNITDAYFGLSATLNYIDQDLLVRGSSAIQAQAQFDELWNAGGRASARGTAAQFSAFCLKQNSRDQAVRKYLVANAGKLAAARPARSCGQVEYVLDRPDFTSCQGCNDPTDEVDPLIGDGLERKRMTSLFLEFVRSTRSSLQISNQYFMPFFRRPNLAFEELRARRVPVQVLTNAAGDIQQASRNKAFTCYLQTAAFAHTMGSQKVELISSKGSMRDPWQLSPPGAEWRIHAKSAIRDRQDVLVSSYNIDPRSYNVNLENGVAVYGCPLLANDMQKQYEQLRGFAKADQTCARCKAEVLPEHKTPSSFQCRGTPLFY